MSASEFLELHLSPDSALEPEHQRECEHYMDDYAAAEVKRVAGPLHDALQLLYDETADYIRTNHLGDVHHNVSMQKARAALAAARAELEAKHEH